MDGSVPVVAHNTCSLKHYCPCLLPWWYVKAVEKAPADSIVDKALACLWTYCCTTCAVYVASVEDNIDPVEELKKNIEVLKKVICIDRS